MEGENNGIAFGNRWWSALGTISRGFERSAAKKKRLMILKFNCLDGMFSKLCFKEVMLSVNDAEQDD